MIKVKVCGMNESGNIKAIAAFLPDYFGFIFYEKSPRAFKLQNLTILQNVKKVGVFVNAEIDVMVKNQRRFQLDAIQLHGEESRDVIAQLKVELTSDVEIFKALSIKTAEDIQLTKIYEDLVDVFILDTKTPLKGGSGRQFNWELLDGYKSDTPFLLSGGIGPNDVDKIKKVYTRYSKMIGVDINSKFELKPGLKSVDEIKRFIKTLNT